MKYIHSGCGGEIDTRRRKCLLCGKKWTLISFWLTAGEIRPYKVEAGAVKRTTSYARWADRIPFVPVVAGHLPNWPRWARILSTVVVYGSIITLILWLVGVLR